MAKLGKPAILILSALLSSACTSMQTMYFGGK